MNKFTGLITGFALAFGIATSASANDGFFSPPHWQNLKNTTAQEGVTRGMWERAKHFRAGGSNGVIDFRNNVGVNAPHPLFLHPDDRPGPAFEVVEVQTVPLPEEKPVHETVNFAWDSAKLTPQAMTTLDKLVVEMDENTVVDVTGHTDTSGPAKYNRKLGLDRAYNVAGYLQNKGVSVDVISSFGESKPLVETGDGVRNKENRRVVITE